MKTVNLEYTVENIQTAFKHFAHYTYVGGAPSKQFSVVVDSTTLVERTGEREQFADFLLYHLDACDRLVITVYELYEENSTQYIFDMAAARKRRELAEENRQLHCKVAKLTRHLHRARRKKIFERVNGIKAVDATDCVVVFLPKSEIDEVFRHELDATRAGLAQMETAYNYFRQIIFHSKKD